MNRERTLKVLLFSVLIFVLSRNSVQLSASFQSNQQKTPYSQLGTAENTRIQPVLFVPNNLIADPASLTAIDETMQVLRSWYASQLRAKTFNVLPAVEVAGQYELKHYCPNTTVDTQCIQVPGQIGADPGDIYFVLDDLSAQGYPIEENVILVIFWVGGYGYAGGSKWSNRSGMAAMGDWALDGILEKYELGTSTSNCHHSSSAAVICRKNAQIGTVGHELAHAFGLPHPTNDNSQPGDPNYWLSTIMAVPWDFPNVVLIDSSTNPEKTTLVNHAFFESIDTFLPFIVN